VRLTAADDWIRARVAQVVSIETVRERPWSTVLRVTHAGGLAWFKACRPMQGFEPRLSAGLFARWPDRVSPVIDCDEERAWLLLRPAGIPLRETEPDNPPQRWCTALPRYAELQRGEAAHAGDHVAHGVPDLRIAALPARFEDLLRPGLPLATGDAARLRSFAPGFERLCGELGGSGLPASIQHDDLHAANLYVDGERLRVLDWGDASVAHPFFSLVVSFRFLEETNGFAPANPWFDRLRDAYLEPWGRGHDEAFALALRVGTFAHAIAWIRQRDHLPPDARPAFDRWLAVILARALQRIPR
jgi:hypothetical protein